LIAVIGLHLYFVGREGKTGSFTLSFWLILTNLVYTSPISLLRGKRGNTPVKSLCLLISLLCEVFEPPFCFLIFNPFFLTHWGLKRGALLKGGAYFLNKGGGLFGEAL